MNSRVTANKAAQIHKLMATACGREHTVAVAQHSDPDFRSAIALVRYDDFVGGAHVTPSSVGGHGDVFSGHRGP